MEISEDERVRLRLHFGVAYIETLLQTSVDKAMKDSIDALFASVVLGSWTAFECLAADLWSIGVDHGPKEVAARLAISNQLQKHDENITAKTVHTTENDPRFQYGSWLLEVGKVSFQKLELIKLYYSIAFGEEYKKLFTDTADGYIGALSCVRNALIHRSGIADKKFVERAQQFPELRIIKAGDLVLLDGEFVKKLRSAAAEVGWELISRMDALLSAPGQA